MQDSARTLVAQCAIAAALCAGVFALLVEPLRERQRAARAELQAYIHETSDASRIVSQLPDLLTTLRLAEQDAAEIAAHSRLAQDEGAVFAALMELAERTGVVVEHVIPTPVGSPPTQAGRPEQSAERPGDRQVRYSLTGSGRYAEIAEFLDGLQSGADYSTIRSCRVTPKYEAGSRDALFSIVIDYFAFDASPVVLDEKTGV